MQERRQITFENIEAILPDVERLLAGHMTLGNWTLGSICDHLAKTIVLSIDTSPTEVPDTREQVIYRRLFFRASAFPEGQGIPLAIQTPEPDVTATYSAEALRTAIARLASHEEPFARHPMLGTMTRDQWLLFHARHAAHHLSFAVPI